MSFFERLKTAASAEWRAYTEHPFTNALADGSLAEAAFRHYLVQDYLFLIEFARAYALSVSIIRPGLLTCAKRRPASPPFSMSR
jgi:thiaminase/transcriptional activator TenA